MLIVYFQVFLKNGNCRKMLPQSQFRLFQGHGSLTLHNNNVYKRLILVSLLGRSNIQHAFSVRFVLKYTNIPETQYYTVCK